MTKTVSDDKGIVRKLNQEVWCTLQMEGVHCWPGCPYDEVAYLRDPHRHLFGIKAYAEVSHGDRDIEFIMLKHNIRNYLINQYWNKELQLLKFGAMSCEMIAEELIKEFDLTRCEVDEDGENGAVLTVTWTGNTEDLLDE